MSSLELFLTGCQLEQYYSSFLNTGATDHDLPDLLELNENELNEMIHAVKMLPFHSIKFKKALREYRSSSTPESMASSTRSTQESSYTIDIQQEQEQENEKSDSKRSTIVSHALIYGKNSTRPLTNYEKAINQASIEFALHDPSLLINKGRLFDLAKKKLLEEGYQYKRGKSRSKFLSGASNTTEENRVSLSPPVHWLSTTSTHSPPLSPTLSLDERKRVKRKEHAVKQSTERRFRIDQLEKELIKLRSSNQDSQLEASLMKTIAKLKAQERKHQWYKRKTQSKSMDKTTPPPTLPSPPHLFLSPPPFNSDFYFRPLSPPIEVRDKVLTVRDCCNA